MSFYNSFMSFSTGIGQVSGDLDDALVFGRDMAFLEPVTIAGVGDGAFLGSDAAQIGVPIDLDAVDDGGIQASGNAGAQSERRFEGLDGVERVLGGTGDDLLSAGPAGGRVFGFAGDDVLLGGAGDDRLDGSIGDDVLFGGEGADILWGSHGDDIYLIHDLDDSVREYKEQGFDILRVSVDGFHVPSGIERVELLSDEGVEIRGSVWRDLFFGSVGDDLIRAGRGNDLLQGEGGDDILIGHVGFDTIQGGAGDDVIKGDGGNDRLTGDAGSDRFFFQPGDDIDRVFDFTPGEDLLDVRKYGLADFDAFLDAARTTNAGDTMIDLAAGDRIVLFGVSTDDLSAADVLI